MRNYLITAMVLIGLVMPLRAHALSISAPPPEKQGDVLDLPLYVPYHGVLMVDPTVGASDSIPATLLIDGVEFMIVVDNPNLLPLLWGLREGAYELTAVGYLSRDVGFFPNPFVEVDVIHVIQFQFE